MMITTLSKNETTQLIQGPAGQLELITSTPFKENKGWGIVCHPHPLFSGTMHNKVVTTVCKAFQNIGLNSVRFNFRGVGLSEGKYDEGKGEIEDLLAVIDWVSQNNFHLPLFLAGFSFGAYIAAKASLDVATKKLLLIAPPVEHFPMQFIPPFTCPWILVQGDKDEVVPAEKVLAWADHRTPRPTLIRFAEASHFFHGQLTELRTRIEEALLR